MKIEPEPNAHMANKPCFHPFRNHVDKIMIRNSCPKPVLINNVKDDIGQVCPHIYIYIYDETFL
ncbi:hypothetical protein BRW84_08835 [Oxalobacter formigenes OXCC13]|nr:hypothetical protein BRW84_08835 [Oxalobacter formigenes OXCC13]